VLHATENHVPRQALAICFGGYNVQRHKHLKYTLTLGGYLKENAGIKITGDAGYIVPDDSTTFPVVDKKRQHLCM